MTVLVDTGVFLGNPRDPEKRVQVNLSTDQLKRAEIKGVSPEKLAVALLEVLFTFEELSTGNCTQPRKEGIRLLDATKLNGIRGALIEKE